MTEIIEYPRVTQDPEPQITKKYIYDLLKYNKIIRANILRERMSEARAETISEAIEGKLLGATDYGRDCVQSSHEPEALPLSAVNREIWKQRAEMITREAVIDAQNLEIEHLDDAVWRLPPLLHAVIIKIYYERLSLKETAEALRREPFLAYHEESYFEKVKERAVQRIADIFNAHCASMIHDFQGEDDLR